MGLQSKGRTLWRYLNCSHCSSALATPGGPPSSVLVHCPAPLPPWSRAKEARPDVDHSLPPYYSLLFRLFSLYSSYSFFILFFRPCPPSSFVLLLTHPSPLLPTLILSPHNLFSHMCLHSHYLTLPGSSSLVPLVPLWPACHLEIMELSHLVAFKPKRPSPPTHGHNLDTPPLPTATPSGFPSSPGPSPTRPPPHTTSRRTPSPGHALLVRRGPHSRSAMLPSPLSQGRRQSVTHLDSPVRRQH